uniref:Immunoglobulin C1-set domain-containing protein n=1 Tax=Cyprinus carpio TaxID=7962 RepID=A0A8C1SX17_CYPCA
IYFATRTKFFVYLFVNCIIIIFCSAPPDVHVFVRKAPDDQNKQVLTCLATGFYPRDIKMNIRLYRNIIKDQTSSEIRPNADGSFQMRVSVEFDRNHKDFYDCFVIHSSLTEPAVVEW